MSAWRPRPYASAALLPNCRIEGLRNVRDSRASRRDVSLAIEGNNVRTPREPRNRLMACAADSAVAALAKQVRVAFGSSFTRARVAPSCSHRACWQHDRADAHWEVPTR